MCSKARKRILLNGNRRRNEILRKNKIRLIGSFDIPFHFQWILSISSPINLRIFDLINRFECVASLVETHENDSTTFFIFPLIYLETSVKVNTKSFAGNQPQTKRRRIRNTKEDKYRSFGASARINKE
jgi:hypothetical protein